MYVDAEHFMYLQYQVKNQKDKIKRFESGAEYQKMQEGNRRIRHYYERKLSALGKELGECHIRESRNRNQWFQVFQDVQDECERRIQEIKAERDYWKGRAEQEAEKNRQLQAKLREKMNEVVEARAATNEEKEKNQKLQAQISQDFTNSSIPSSQVPIRGKVTNNREKTGRKPGGQPGHAGHRRKTHPVNGRSVFIPAPEEIEKDPGFYRQGGVNSEIHKQVVGVRLVVTVDDYWAYVYRNRATGAKYHAPFPDNVRLEVNYDESVKALIFLMKNHCNVSENKIQEFFREMTQGELSPSRGMINTVNAEFMEKTKKEQAEIFQRLVTSEVMYTDMTASRMNGKNKNIVVCTDGQEILYFFRDNKGDRAFDGTPVKLFTNTLVHDHDRTMYHYGSTHQECNEHHLRYLKGAMENEPGLHWHGEMRSLLQEMNRTREAQGRKLRVEQIEDYKKRYDRILDKADKEYEENPPSKYYRKGYNLSVELREYKDSVLYFLEHEKVDFTNNVSERGCRKVKRHQAVSGTFRGNTNHSGEEYCAAMSVIQSAAATGKNVYQTAAEIFSRSRPPKQKDVTKEDPLTE